MAASGRLATGRDRASRLKPSRPPHPIGDCSVRTSRLRQTLRLRGAPPLPPAIREHPPFAKSGVQGRSPCGNEAPATAPESERCSLPTARSVRFANNARRSRKHRQGACSRPCQAMGVYATSRSLLLMRYGNARRDPGAGESPALSATRPSPATAGSRWRYGIGIHGNELVR